MFRFSFTSGGRHCLGQCHDSSQQPRPKLIRCQKSTVGEDPAFLLLAKSPRCAPFIDTVGGDLAGIHRPDIKRPDTGRLNELGLTIQGRAKGRRRIRSCAKASYGVWKPHRG